MSRFNRVTAGCAAAAMLAVSASPALAALEAGAQAEDFSAPGALAGEEYSFDLAEARANGPVVLYFFPAAFTPGCNIEAGLFSQAIEDFEAEGATVIGVTAGNTDRLIEFSSEHCQDKFAVAAADEEVISAYDVALDRGDSVITTRTSYVISPEGEVLFVHDDFSPEAHITESLAAVKAWNAEH